LSNALAALAARMEPKDAASVFKALEYSRIGPYNPPELSNVLAAALVARMEPNDARNVADGLAKALEDSKTSAKQLPALGRGLAALAAHMEPKEAAGVSSRGVRVLLKAAEDPEIVPSLSDALAALAAWMEPKGVAGVAEGLVKALDNLQENDSGSLLNLGRALGTLSLRVPSARQTRCLALSMILLNEVPAAPKIGEVEPKERKQLAELDALIDPQDLAEVLKWPFTVGEAEKITLAELENKTGRKFGGNIWKFVEQAPSLGIKNIEGPAKRPKVEDARKELKSIATGTEVPLAVDQ